MLSMPVRKCYFINTLGLSATRREEHLNYYYVCFLRSKKNGSLYIGQTSNLEKRLERHNKGQIKSTKSRAPFDLIYFERYNKRRQAMYREWMLKSASCIEEKKSILKTMGL
jgi:putative endonuclease